MPGGVGQQEAASPACSAPLGGEGKAQDGTAVMVTPGNLGPEAAAEPGPQPAAR